MAMRTTTAAAATPARHSRLRVALGTFVAIDAQALEPGIAERALARAWDAILTVERLMHPHRLGSDLAALNQCVRGASVVVHEWTKEVLELSSELNDASGGVFDPCLSEAPGRLTDLELLAGYAVRPRVPVRIDLGGIAKGYAVDRALAALRSAGCSGGLVNAGGDLAAFGEQAHLIRCGPSSAPVLFELRDAALATSDADAPHRPAEHRGYYHGIDRGVGARGRVSVTAPRAALADALTKCALMCEPRSGAALLARFGAQVVYRAHDAARTPARGQDRAG
jgi:FAD:protein FMN transferase